MDGPKAGQAEVFAQNMAGLPDNLAVCDDGTLLVAWVQPNRADLARIMALPFALRWLIVRLPEFMKPQPSDDLMVARYDFDGRLLGSLALQGAGFHFVTGARQVGDWIYLGSIAEDAIARVPADAV